MRAITYRQNGDPDVLTLVDKPLSEPGPGEVRVRIHRSGVNPTDWKSRRGTRPGNPVDPPQVPNQDGSGVVDAVGPGVEAALLGLRVWVWEAAYQRPEGTAQEYALVPAHQVVHLPDSASFDLGAALGVPFLTAHRALTVTEDGPLRLGPGTLQGRTVLVAGGAGADHVIDYRQHDVVAEVRKIAPDGVSTIVEVAAAANADIDVGVIGRHGSVAVYADDGGAPLSLPVRPLMVENARWQFVLVYTAPADWKRRAIADVSAAVLDGAVRVGEEAGLPLHHFPLERTADAHAAVEAGAVGKVLVDVAE